MSFAKLDITYQLLSELKLPEKLDEKHPYHYWIFRHTDENAMFIKRSYSHGHESFQDMELWLSDDRYIIEEKVKITDLKGSWDYLLTDLIAYVPTNCSNKRKQVIDYMSDILGTYDQGKYSLRISDSVNLVLDSTKLGGTFMCPVWPNPSFKRDA